MSMARKIFISYRREADAGHAGRLHEDLSERFCRRNLFIDLELRPGQQWQERIEQAVAACDVVLPVIGTRWATVTNERESGRLERSEDWVKLEIETALMRQDVVVIPVLVGGAQMPAAADLPESLRPMTKWQAQHLSDHSWEPRPRAADPGNPPPARRRAHPVVSAGRVPGRPAGKLARQGTDAHTCRAGLRDGRHSHLRGEEGRDLGARRSRDRRRPHGRPRPLPACPVTRCRGARGGRARRRRRRAGRRGARHRESG